MAKKNSSIHPKFFISLSDFVTNSYGESWELISWKIVSPSIESMSPT